MFTRRALYLVSLTLSAFAVCTMTYAHAEANSASETDTINYDRKITRLSAILGNAHAIRTLCNGPSDQIWRVYMSHLLDAEAPEKDSRYNRFLDAFNAGYYAERQKSEKCSGQLKNKESRLAKEGQAITEKLIARDLR